MSPYKTPATVAVTKTVAEWSIHLAHWPGIRDPDRADQPEHATSEAQQRIDDLLQEAEVTLEVLASDYELTQALETFIVEFNAGWKLAGRTKE